MPAEPRAYPKKYWWVVLVALPIVLGLIAVLPRWSGNGSSPAVAQTGVGNVAQVGTGNVNVTTNDYSTKFYLTTVSMIVDEYQRFQGQPLSDDALTREIERAVTAAVDGNATNSARLFEELARKLPLPAIYNNLGVEYAKAGQTQAAQKAFMEAIRRNPQHEDAKRNLALLASTVTLAPAPGTPTSPALNVETSAVPTIVIEPLTPAPHAIKEIHIVDAGTAVTGSYRYRYNAQPGIATIVDAGQYDIVFKSTGDGTFVLARNVEVKDATRVRINPAALVGYIQVEPLTAKGFPALAEVTVYEAGTTGYRYIHQHSAILGELLPIPAGAYEVVGKTVEGQDVVLAKRVEVTLLETARITPNDALGAFLVRDPNIAGSKVESVFVLRAGTNEIVAQADHFGTLVVDANETYDIALKQPSGLARIRSTVTAKRGEVTTVP